MTPALRAAAAGAGEPGGDSRPPPRDRDWQGAPVASGAYRPWLTDRGSLTARIALRCPEVTVQVVFQGLRRPNRDEQFLFTDGGRAHALTREVLLLCRGVPVVFAHTVLDRRDVRGAWRSVAGLGSRPLAAALFADPRVQRYALHQRKLGAHHELHRRLGAILPGPRGALWARRSLFRLHDSPILVTEVFLPEILRL